MSDKKGLPLEAWLIIGIPVIGVLLIYLLFPGDQQQRDNFINAMGTTNHGVLIQPALDASKESIVLHNGESIKFGEENSRWKMLIVDDGSCAEACQESLFITRQIHRLIPKRSNRIERLYVSANSLNDDVAESLQKDDPSLLIAQGDLAVVLEESDVPFEQFGIYYLVDSKGQIIMYYTTNHNYKKIIKDLKVLL